MMKWLGLFETGPERFQPDPKYVDMDEQQYMLDQRFLSYLVGTIALGLPAVLFLAAQNSAIGICFYKSISHFYYAQFFGDVFVAALAFIGAFLLAYRGENLSESRLATITGIWAFGVALFPTKGRGCDENVGDQVFSGRVLAELKAKEDTVTVSEEYVGSFFQLFVGAEYLHFFCAALLFAFLAYYALFVFTRVIEDQHRDKNGNLTSAKKVRNLLYKGSGVTIVICMTVIAAYGIYCYFAKSEWSWWEDNKATFWLETFSLWAFGVSWMVKGRFFGKFLLDPRDQLSPDAAG